MPHAYLITGGDNISREAKALDLMGLSLGQKQSSFPVNNPDFIYLEDHSIKIAQIRNLKKNLSLKPFSAKIKIVFINHAETTTLPAQQALLKTIEEPPGDCLLILATQYPEQILPTIHSRCQIINLPAPNLGIDFKASQQLFKTICSLSLGERLNYVKKEIKTAEQAAQITLDQLAWWRQILLETVQNNKTRFALTWSVEKIIFLTKKAHDAYTMIQSNVNFRLVLGDLFLNYPQIGIRTKKPL
ncbi:hypothetical protein ACFLZP_00775 [Patescibacteria group bacterium]